MMATNTSVYRKPKIKAPRKLATPHQDTFERLAAAIREIQAQNGSKLSFEEHYRYAYTMVLHKDGARLYQGISKLVADHLDQQTRTRIQPAFPSSSSVASGAATASGSSSMAAPSARGATDLNGPAASVSSDAMELQASAQEGEKFLAALKAVWDDHTACMSKLKDLLKYMDKVYVESSQPRQLATYDLGLQLFLEHVIRNSELPVHHHLISVLLSQIRLDRQGHVVNKSALRSCISMLNMLRDQSPNRQQDGSVYQIDFEARFLEETRHFYSAEATNLLTTGSAADFLQKVERRLWEEDARLHHYLSLQTEPALVALLESTFIASRLDAILKHPDGGLNLLLEHSRVSDLSRLYRLFSRVPEGPTAMRRALREWIKNTGLALAAVAPPPSSTAPAEDEADPKGKGKAKEAAPPPAALAVSNALHWVQSVLDLKDKTDALLKDAFESSHEFVTASTDAFSTFITAHQRPAEYISLFLDDNLRKGLKGKNDAETDVVINKAITVFRFLSEKDTFEVYYRRHLGRRLLSNRSVSDDAERGVLAKLKVECGAAFVRDLEGMMKDVRLSAEMTSAYRDHLQNSNTPMPLDLSVQVCTSSHWPLQQPANAKSEVTSFPPDFLRAIKSFEAFYLQRHSGRKLTWRPDLGSVDVRVQFKSRKHDINMSTQSMLALSLFESLGSEDALTLQDVQTGTGLALPELKRVLQSLACGKFKILTKEPKSRDVNDNDRFYFNDSFSTPLARFKIQQIANRVESTEEGKATRSKVEDERKMLANAAVVRTMKDRKMMMHSDLVNEVTRQLASRFQPRPAMIKQSIESMLEQEYLSRDDDDRRKLTYVA